jgi:hypothetical protein
MFQVCHTQLSERAEGTQPDRLANLEDKIDTVCRAVEELRQIVCAQTMSV